MNTTRFFGRATGASACFALLIGCSEPPQETPTDPTASKEHRTAAKDDAATGEPMQAPRRAPARDMPARDMREGKKKQVADGKALATKPRAPGKMSARTRKLERGRGSGRRVEAEKSKSGFVAESANREAYDAIVENDFARTDASPLSTFSIDVDTASYSNVRRMLRSGRLPPAGAVRIEEMLNYFEYAYPTPAGDAPFSTFVEAGPCPWNREHRLVHIGLRGKEIPKSEVPPRNLVFLLDVSGSMRSRNKLPLLQSAMEVLVNQLNEDDSVAIVVYAGASGLVLPATHGDDKERIRQALRNLRAGGSTNGGAGIRLAYKTARENFRKDAINRVILATDGDFNVGTSSRSGLIQLIEKEREDGVFLTVLGLGSGNLQDSTMEQLANKGNGNYAYLDSIDEAKKVLGQQAGGTLITIAKDVKIQVEFNPRKVKAYRLIGYENRMLAARDFDDDQKDAGEIGAGHSVTALYEVVPVGAKTELGAAPKLKYQQPKELTIAADSDELMTLRLRFKEPTGARSRLLTKGVVDPGPEAKTSSEFDFAAGVAMFGMLLRGSKFRGSSSYRLAGELANGGIGEDRHGYRKEFLGLVERAGQLATPASVGSR